MKAVIALSGGIDSATLLGYLLASGSNFKPDDVLAVSFDYGSKHWIWEGKAAEAIALHYGVHYRRLNLIPFMTDFKSALLLSGDTIPEGHYNDVSMKQTVVPCRNMIFASILAGIAESNEASFVYLGIHAGDHYIYPDCRPAFYNLMSQVIAEATESKVFLLAPFLQVTKTEVVKIGFSMRVPYHLTRTCYTSNAVACGKCGSCRERKEAFERNNVVDPISYQE